MFRMSDEEKILQIGKAVEEYSRLKGELNHVQEKINLAQQSYVIVGQNISAFRIQDGKLMAPPSPQHGRAQQQTVDGLLSTRELIEVLETKERLTAEVNGAAARLRALAPHLL